MTKYVEPAPDTNALMVGIDAERLVAVIRAKGLGGGDDTYIHWDKLRHLTPPAGLSWLR